MNIRMDSKEVRMRLNQEEVNALIQNGIIREAITLPKLNFSFQVKLHNHIGLHHKENEITFCLDQTMREKLLNPEGGKVAEIAEGPVCYKLEVDLFKRATKK